jgi:hypothetical protein
MLARIGKTTDEFTRRFELSTSMLDRVTAELSGKLEGTGQRFAAVLDQASTAILTDLGKAAEAFNVGLSETAAQISGILQQDTGQLANRVELASRELEQVSVNTTTKLEEANRKFVKHMETVNAFLADQLAGAASVMDERLGAVSQDLMSRLETTSTRVSARLDDTSLTVERAVEHVDSEMERLLAVRRDALEALLAQATRQSNEIGGAISNYMSAIENSLAASEDRARDIGRIIAEQAAVASRNLSQEITKLEGSSAGQIDQAARMLRDQHERAMAAMNEMLSSTAADFQHTAHDMRLTAQQVVKDIDTARGELMRSLTELPEETRNNADAMRRVVADQIGALNALAEVVRRQADVLDATGPGASVNRGRRDSTPRN